MYQHNILNMKNTADIGREILLQFNKSAHSFYINKSLPILGVITAMLPALCSCRKEMTDDNFDETTEAETDVVETKIGLGSGNCSINTLDLFTFEDGEIQTLDSYQRIDGYEGNEAYIASRHGDRILFVCANGQWSRSDWMYVNSYESIASFRASLENEMRQYPLMTGTHGFTAGDMQKAEVELERVTSEVILRSVTCDFSGKSYEDEGIRDMKAYLINVNAQCGLEADGTVMPERIINMGGLSSFDMEAMTEPDLLYRRYGDIDSGETVYPDIRLRCYPNTCTEESPGSPFTRLTLEGNIYGESCYWSVNVGRDDTDIGIERNCIYTYDIIITGKGTKNPDLTVRKADMTIALEVKKWTEKEYSVCF